MTPQDVPIGRDDLIVLRLKTPTSTKIDDLAAVRGPLATFLKANNLSSSRAIRSVQPGQLLEWETAAKKGAFPPRRSLTAYWLLDARRATRPLKQLLTDLRRIASVAEAYQQPQYKPAVAIPVNDPMYVAGDQGYLGPAPAGIDAYWAWQLHPSRDGTGGRFIDVEAGWQNGHEDVAPFPPSVGGVPYAQGNLISRHGLAVFGIVKARTGNGLGIAGVAPGATATHVAAALDAAGNQNVADALMAVRAVASAGDVVLIELQTDTPPIELPVESRSLDFAAISLTVGGGLVVIEAAGNHGVDLGPVLGTGDSGAIVVGGAVAAVPHEWITTNWGARVDTYAWARDVYTTGGAGTSPLPAPAQDATNRYTTDFGGSSAAAAIVAGAALIIQGAYGSSSLGLRTPSQMRDLFRTIGTDGGVPIDPVTKAWTGTPKKMPDLRKLLPDIYVRDDLADDGSVPTAGLLSVSPDVIVTLTEPANPQATYGAGSANENVDTLGEQAEFGQTNYVYVRMKNLGTGMASGCKATVYWSEPSSLVTPSGWHLIGQSGPVDVDSNLTVAPAIPWSTVPATGHYCFIALVDHPLDPQPPLPADWSDFVDFIRSNNNVTWRNFNIVDMVPNTPTPMPFWIKGADDSQRTFDFEVVQNASDNAAIDFEVPLALARKFPAGALPKATIDNDRKVAIYRVAAKQRLAIPKIVVPARARFACRFVVQTKAATTGKVVPTVALRQLFKGEEVGRITWGWRAAKGGARKR